MIILLYISGQSMVNLHVYTQCMFALVCDSPLAMYCKTHS